jgi:cell division protein FtsQ
MWDNPRLLNASANLLAGAAAAAVLFAGLQALMHAPQFALRELTVQGELKRTTRAEIESVLEGRVDGNFFSADLAALRAALERLPWVRRVSVRRVWPGRLTVAFEEHVALARWGEAGLVNTFGEPFNGRTDELLPQFAGPAGTERELARRYRQFSEIVAPLGSPLERLILTPRLAWQMRLESGLTLELGRDAHADAVDERLARFVAVHPHTLGRMPRRHDSVDLRYPNGFALRVQEPRG